MKKQVLFIAAAVIMLVACKPSTTTNEHGKTPADSTQVFNLDTTTLAAGTIYYVCPMTEDSVISNKPGTCPKCGMDLEPRTKQ